MFHWTKRFTFQKPKCFFCGYWLSLKIILCIDYFISQLKTTICLHKNLTLQMYLVTE